MYRYRGRAANDKQISKDRQTEAFAIIGYVFLMRIIAEHATGSFLLPIVISIIYLLFSQLEKGEKKENE